MHSNEFRGRVLLGANMYELLHLTYTSFIYISRALVTWESGGGGGDGNETEEFCFLKVEEAHDLNLQMASE
jgi:hypothetical protein